MAVGKQYDYLVVGAGLFGAVCAYRAKQSGRKVLVIDKRPQLGGNIYCENIAGINVQQYGAHIFHTNNRQVWDFVNSFVEFNNYRHSVLAKADGKIFNLPFNLNTFYALWGVTTPREAAQKIAEQKTPLATEPQNLEEQALALVGRDIYEILIKGYTEKQWGRRCPDLPAFIIKRLPVRFTFDNSYFDDRYQGIPLGGYNKLIEKLLSGVETRTSCDFFAERRQWEAWAEKIVYTGEIDRYFNYEFGKLEYRSIRWETEVLACPNYQGAAVVNYVDGQIPYTRIIEHKHFEFGAQAQTVISREYPAEWQEGAEPFYPINDAKNTALYGKYAELAQKEENVIFGGRLAEYKYYDMDEVIEKALKSFEAENIP
ncbi:UDP-galactopyranose mutase [Candidatus Termititenax persephonae]|uniref:UDP-galactopyranose mutase n=1 Tax=Candidatus Termititenax persephonae TaxID=2218525 RepID=A0A388TI64_9BACT|nr:UDP-galactopyranose mutase [Candidatus Termititenax persephonae]